MKKFLIFLLLALSLVSVSYAQLPDRDGDGVTDSRDDCDREPGPASNNGCPVDRAGTPDAPPPDSDGDGTADPLDRCPNEAGDGANGGCPAGTTATTESPAAEPVNLIAAPTDGNCVASTAGTSPVNIRQYPNIDGEIVGTISPNEWVEVLLVYTNDNVVTSEHVMGDETPFTLFPFDTDPPNPDYPVWFFVKDSDSPAYGWVAEAVLRMGGDCSEFVIEDPLDDASYLKIKLSDVLISSYQTSGGVRVAVGDVNGDGTVDASDYETWRANFGRGTAALPVFPNENPFFWVNLDPQEASVDYFLKIDGIEGESESQAADDAASSLGSSMGFAMLEGACELIANSDGTISPVCEDGGTPPSVTVCSYQQLEAGVYTQVCYEVEIPEGCVLDTSEAGVWHITCEDDGDGVQVNPLGETDPILDIQWGEGTVQVGLLLPAVQKVREAANR